MTTVTGGQGRAVLVKEEIHFDATDAALLHAIDESGSVSRASEALGRSRARALRRIEALEGTFGPLVERRRGGRDGGGSRLTDSARDLLDRFERLATALRSTARVPETVLYGNVTETSGELATVSTSVGEIRGIHDGLPDGASVQVRIGGDAITIHDTGATMDPDESSARNRLSGQVIAFGKGETVFPTEIAVDGKRFVALITAESRERLELSLHNDVLLSWKATATSLVESAQVVGSAEE